jgi:capsular polysaccharide export protein
MTGQIGIFSPGLWRLRREVAIVTGRHPVRRRWSVRELDEVAGWGHKPTAHRARALAASAGLPYAALEDGFLRSLRPGRGEASISYVCDRVGIHYDARAPSGLEMLVHARLAAPEAAARDAAVARDALQGRGLSKYNAFEPLGEADLPSDPARTVLVIDQTHGDASVCGAGADADTFHRMLAAAAEENPDATLVIKTHPETRAGRKAGYLGSTDRAGMAGAGGALEEAVRAGRVTRLVRMVRPRDLFARVGRVYAVSSQLGLEALAAGLPVTCFGRAFYSGWGLTDDRAPPTGRRCPATLDALLAAAFVDYARYFCPVSRRPCTPGEAIEALDALVAAASAGGAGHQHRMAALTRSRSGAVAGGGSPGSGP